MNESHVSKQVPYPEETGEDEISLVDIIKFLWKWKILIIAGVGISAGIAVLINEAITPVYQVEMVIRPNSTGNQDSIESPENIKLLVESKGVADAVLKEFKKENARFMESIKFQAIIPKKGDVIKITHESKDIDLGKSILLKLKDELENQLEPSIRIHKEAVTSEIENAQFILESMEKNISAVEKKIAVLNDFKKKQMKTLEEKIKNYRIQIQENENSIEMLKQKSIESSNKINELIQKDKILIDEKEKRFSKGNLDMDGELRYNTLIQQKIVLIEILKDREIELEQAVFQAMLQSDGMKRKLMDVISEKSQYEYDIKEKISELEIRLAELINEKRVKINELKVKLENKNQIKGVEILQYPAASSRPVKPNKVLNIVLSVFVGGLLTLIIAGTVEFVQKYKSEIVASQ